MKKPYIIAKKQQKLSRTIMKLGITIKSITMRPVNSTPLHSLRVSKLQHKFLGKEQLLQSKRIKKTSNRKSKKF
jgi:hypothetical protein